MVKVFIVCSCLIFMIGCTNAKKNVWPFADTYFAITADGIQTITFNKDSVVYAKIVNLPGVFFTFDSSGYRTDSFKQRIIEISVEDSSRIAVYVDDKKQIGKKIFFLDSSKQKLSILAEDTLFSSLKAARAYKPDLSKKFLFDYYTQQYLLKVKTNPKIYNTDSVTIYKFVDNFEKSLGLNKTKLENTIGYEGLVYLIGRELLNKTFIDMDLNPFVTSDSIEAILKMIPPKE